MNLIHKLTRRIQLLLAKGMILGLLVALTSILLASSPLGRWLEEDIGLSWLFQLRGPQPPSEEVVVVSIDLISSQQLSLANDPLTWPRSLYGKLLRKLHTHGVSVTAFDIFFTATRDPIDNKIFASALHDTANSILFQSVNKQPIFTLTDEGKNHQSGYIESLSQPIPALKNAAFGLAPFPLPKVPAQVNHFKLFIPELGDVPTLPVVALHAHALPVYSHLYDLLTKAVPQQIHQLPDSQQLSQITDIQNLSQSLRQLFLNNPWLAQHLIKQIEEDSLTIKPQQYDLLVALITSLNLAHSQYLNFYGPPHTINTIPFYKVLESADQGDPLNLAGKAVFIGFSEQFQPQQRDGFYTVYSQPQSGLDLSGVEIAATAFANLIQGRTLSSSSATIDMLIYFSWALLLSLLLRNLSSLLIFPSALLLAVAYHQLAFELFRQSSYWLPLSIPLLWQVPLTLIGALVWNYFDVQRERANIRHAFGQHLPIKIVDQLAKNRGHISSPGEQAHGTVLATDAMQYTKLSEQLPPTQLHQLMNRYYETLFTPICLMGGEVSDVVGDAALATWTSPSPGDLKQRNQACRAALQILSGVEDFNRENPAYSLPTRMGLHYGDLIMGHVGAVDHYEYRAVGDTVNTASRIEGLNKQLGTRILVSRDVLGDIDEFITRELGQFLLQGKTKALHLYELVALKDQANKSDPYLGFADALKAFQAQQWELAKNSFNHFLLNYGEDGPSRFYLNLCYEYLKQPPKKWDGIIRISKK